jgi:hypothetical protein
MGTKTIIDVKCYGVHTFNYDVSRYKLKKAEKADIIKGIEIWSRYKTIKCNKCNKYGHKKDVCHLVCKCCNNIHDNRLCIVYLLNEKNLKKFNAYLLKVYREYRSINSKNTEPKKAQNMEGQDYIIDDSEFMKDILRILPEYKYYNVNEEVMLAIRYNLDITDEEAAQIIDKIPSENKQPEFIRQGVTVNKVENNNNNNNNKKANATSETAIKTDGNKNTNYVKNYQQLDKLTRNNNVLTLINNDKYEEINEIIDSSEANDSIINLNLMSLNQSVISENNHSVITESNESEVSLSAYKNKKKKLNKRIKNLQEKGTLVENIIKAKNRKQAYDIFKILLEEVQLTEAIKKVISKYPEMNKSELEQEHTWIDETLSYASIRDKGIHTQQFKYDDKTGLITLIAEENNSK